METRSRSVPALRLTDNDVGSGVDQLTTTLRPITERLRHGVLLEDERRVLMANPALIRMFGTDPRSANAPHAGGGGHLFADPESYAAGVRARITAATPATDDEVVFADGRIAERDYVPLGVGGAHLWVFRDVTEKHRATERLAGENERLTEAAAERDRAILTVSHELRTPLTSIISCTELFVDPNATDTDPSQAEFVAIIERSASRLLELIDDLLALARQGLPADARHPAPRRPH